MSSVTAVTTPLSTIATAVSIRPARSLFIFGNLAPIAPVIAPLIADMPICSMASPVLRTFPLLKSSTNMLIVVISAPIAAPISAPPATVTAPADSTDATANAAQTAKTARPMARFLKKPSQSNFPSLRASSNGSYLR